jgi:methylenetetrahydrofolate dehydrogenase (NADP+)/methenyltetrahydrofolate cyclohydrolase
VSVIEVPAASTTETIIAAVAEASSQSDGVIVQLPLPSTIDTDRVLASIPVTKDVDVFSYQGEPATVLPPVVGAIDSIAKTYSVVWQGKLVVVLGAGRLVGAPAALYATTKGAMVTVLTANSTLSREDYYAAIKAADIIILGAGEARLITPEMVKPGVVVFDAGASEDGGVLVGDADPAVAEVASLFTPVPGGIGPLTVALLFRNLLELRLRQ